MPRLYGADAVPAGMRRRVLYRDGHRCAMCWNKWQHIEVHHIRDSFCDVLTPNITLASGEAYQNPYRNTRDCDLVTLCGSCHGKAHTCDHDSPWYQTLLGIVKRNAEMWAKS